MMPETAAPPLTPATTVKLPLAAWVLLTVSASTTLGGYVVEKYDLAENRQRIAQIERERKADHELLTRMDANFTTFIRNYEKGGK